MATTIESMLGDLVGRQAAALGERVGLDENQARAAVHAALPAILGGMARNTSTPEGAQRLNRALEKDHDGSLLEAADAHVTRGDTGEGDAILAHVFGETRSNVARETGRVAGVEEKKMEDVMNVLAPIVMAQMGKARRQGAFDAGELAGMLGGGAGSASTGRGGIGQIASNVISQLGASHFERLGARFGLSPESTRLIVELALPLIVAALARNAQREDGAQALTRALEEDHDGSLLRRTDRFITDGDPVEGDKILQHVFGERRAVVERGVARSTGVKPSGVSQIFSMLAPLVLAELGRRRSEGHMDAQAVSRELQQERQTLARDSAGLGSMVEALIDRDGDGDATDDAFRIGAGLIGRLFGSSGS